MGPKIFSHSQPIEQIIYLALSWSTVPSFSSFSAAAFCFIKIFFSSEVASLPDLSSRTSPVERLRGFRNVTILSSLLFSPSFTPSSVLLGSIALHFRSLIFAHATSCSSLGGGEFGPPFSTLGFFFKDFRKFPKSDMASALSPLLPSVEI